MKARLLQGIKAKCVDGRWAPTIFPCQHAARSRDHAGLQCWKDGEQLDELDERRTSPLSDPDELSTKIPQEEWELGLNSKPKPPWALDYVVYLVNPESAELYTFINSTNGARLAYERWTASSDDGADARRRSHRTRKARQPADEDEGGRLKAAAGIHHPRMAGHRGRRGQAAATAASARQGSDWRSREAAGGKEADANWQAGEAGYSRKKNSTTSCLFDRSSMSHLGKDAASGSDQLQQDNIAGVPCQSSSGTSKHARRSRSRPPAHGIMPPIERRRCCASASRLMTPSRKSGHRGNRSRKPSSRPPPIRTG